MGTREIKKETPISRPPPPPWIELPGDVMANILQRLDALEILTSAEKVCTRWKKVCLDPAMWRVVILETLYGDEREFDAVCRCAVDRSQGQLVGLIMNGFGGDDLITYVAHRSGNLGRLAIECTENISASVLTEAVKKLPRLEELHLLDNVLKLAAKDVETVGISCPLLKAFTHSQHWIGRAIAKTMPNCVVSGSVETRWIMRGWKRFLMAAPTFNCWGLDLQLQAGSTLGQRCSNQIKFLRLPFRPAYDDWDGCDDDILFLCHCENCLGLACCMRVLVLNGL